MGNSIQIKEPTTEKLELIIAESGLEKTKADFMLDNFKDYFKIASEWEVKSKALIVTDEKDTATMKMAKEGRLFLRSKRIDVENARKKMKEQSLREGKAIDGIANVLKALIEPIEEHLEEQEKFAERMEAQRLALLKEERLVEVAPYSEYLPFGVDLATLSSEDYQKVLQGAKLQKEAAEQKAIAEENARIEREKKEAEERERIRLENERLKAEAAEREAAIAVERAKVEQERREAEEKARIEREAAAEAIRKEQAERQRIEAEIKAKEQAIENERKAKEVADEKERVAKELADKKAKAAPDKEKLAAFAAMLDGLILPDVRSDEAKRVVENIKQLLSKTSAYIRQQELV